MEVRIDGLVYQRVSDSNLGDLFVPGQANPGKNYFLQKINQGRVLPGLDKQAKWLESTP